MFWSDIMKCPLYIDGEEKGTLTVTQDKLHLVFSAECEYTPKLVRLSVFGGGKSALLGVMEPRGDKLVLYRRKSRNELYGFPKPIEYAADKILEEKNDDILWRRADNGTLVSEDYIAIPCRIRNPKNCDIRVIDGREYIVFPGKIKRWKKDG